MTDDVAPENDVGQRALLGFGFEHDPSVDGLFTLRMTRERHSERCG